MFLRGIERIFRDVEGAGGGGGGGQQPAGAQQPTGGNPAGTQQPAAAPDWFAGLAPEFQGNQHLAGFKGKKLDEFAADYVATKGLVGQQPAGMVKLPDPTDVKGRDALMRKLGVPDSPENYDLALPDDLAKDADVAKGFTADTAKWMAQTAHKLGIPADIAKSLYGEYAKLYHSGVQAQKAQADTKAQNELQALETKYGPAIDNTLAEAGFAANRFGVLDVINEAGLGTHPGVVALLAHAAKHMSEGGEGGPGVPRGDNTRMTPSQAMAKGEDLVRQAHAATTRAERLRLGQEAQSYFQIAAAG